MTASEIRPASAFLHAGGRLVVLDAAACAALVDNPSILLARGHRVPPAIAQQLVAIRTAAMLWREVTGRGPLACPRADSRAGSPRLLSTAEAAGRFGVNERTVRRWVASGRLAGTRVGGRWLIDPDGGPHDDNPQRSTPR